MSPGRFAEPAAALEAIRLRWRNDGLLRVLPPADPPWPRGRRLVLGADAALDLGTPAAGSRAFLLWAEAGEEEGGSEILLLGPDVPELVAAGVREAPLGLVIVARGRFEDEYEGYLDLKEALYGLELRGLTLRSMPSQGHIWLRLHRDAVAEGFSLAHLGGALVEELSAVDAVRALTVLFVAGEGAAISALAPVADDVKRRVAALIKRHEEDDAECAVCEYQDICDEKEHP